MSALERKRGAPVDWEAVRRRLEETRQAAEGTLRLTPERAAKTLDERARKLAQPPAAAPRREDLIELALIALAGERYALETRCIREVLPLAGLTPVPGAPDFLAGVLNLRGEILPVFDLRKLFALAAKEATALSRVIVLGAERAEFGLLAEEALGVTSLRKDEVLDPPLSAARIGREYLRGITKDALIVLSGEALLKDAGLAVAQDAAGEGQASGD